LRFFVSLMVLGFPGCQTILNFCLKSGVHFTGQLTEVQAQAAWMQFERVCANDLRLLPVETMSFHKAAVLTMKAATGLRAGDALHLACALEAKATGMVTLDVVLAKNAKSHKIALNKL